jgi:cytoskeletal protein RodZ
MDVGSYLRSARERQRLSLAELSRHTKINCELLVDLENNDLSRWPRHRVYRHGHLRSYALALGLDPKKVLKQFDDEFGDPYPAAFHGRPKTSFQDLPPLVRSGFLPASLVIVIGAALAVFDVSNNNVKATATQPPPPQIQYRPQEAVRSVSVSDRVVPPIEDVEPIPSDIEGELRIVSKPEGAHVTVNGIARGQTPLRVRYLPIGSYTIRVIQPGYKIGQAVVALRPEEPNRTVRVVLRDEPMFARTTYP